MLFITVVELLAAYIRQTPKIKGININGIEYVISQLADDTTLFLSDKESVKNSIAAIDRFYESTGLRLNKQKCEIFINILINT